MPRRDLADRHRRGLRRHLPGGRSEVDGRLLVQIIEGAGTPTDPWRACAPATYNRHRKALSSVFAWTTDRGWTATTL